MMPPARLTPNTQKARPGYRARFIFAYQIGSSLERDELRTSRHRALDSCLRMIFSENRCALFRIMR